ncbi:hypothetical protein NEUTE1DRAFT_146910 [Neurospora tetrasperma FGSC 2508]|uniref:Large ribosomal subunit protein bL28m n=1 Tax=Neurospora tetrasperma (strain FGSC 2508 / ATCC MYA-4615 / P0657) TaxID=510951 RepID=F8MNH9_NEUT8|nr:uncharacterized protein NEUTE1DRAFT_146910 [Neurospora tetrasperma FGSC 2508]EGO56154.1 hypothetical protein NEUTE1DRAFT_146910 [Neurospora tetrasperma FGSC 2508]EGZ70993.1 hypothetical protein NEUTE2DRAFT_92885 [Neurospora tetrasperma FGSC 2509]
MSSFLPRPCLRASTLGHQLRTLTTTTPHFYHQPRVPSSSIPIPNVSGRVPLPDSTSVPEDFKIEIPSYPYGPRRVYHQSNTGLYGSALIRFGNNVSKRNEIKTRRKWRPNVQQKRLWSKSLGVFVRTRVTTRVLRTIDKVGGLDEYLLGHKAARVKELGPWGWMLRWRIMQTPEIRERFAKEREALGLSPQAKEEEKSLEEQLKEFQVAGIQFAEGKEPKSKGQLKEEADRLINKAETEEFGLGEEEDLFMKEEPKPTKMA